eukprot:m51a1_g4027 putative glycosyl hydrolase family protein isoform 3 (481) ;mRNA; f:632597-638942
MDGDATLERLLAAAVGGEPFVVIYAEAQMEQDKRFMIDATRWAVAFEAGGVPTNNIAIFGKTVDLEFVEPVVRAYSGALGISADDFHLIYGTHYHGVGQRAVQLLSSHEALSRFACVTLILLDHGSPAGEFNGKSLDTEKLARAVTNTPVPTLVVSCACFSLKLFAQLSRSSPSRGTVVRLYDNGDSGHVTWSWTLPTDDPTRGPAAVGTLLTYNLLDIIFDARDQREILSGIYQRMTNPVHDTSGRQTCHIVVEGHADLIQRHPFFGKTAIAGRLKQSKVILSVRPHGVEESLDSERPYVLPQLSQVLAKLLLPPEFWDDVYDTEVMRRACADERLESTSEEVYKLLEAKGLVDDVFPGGGEGEDLRYLKTSACCKYFMAYDFENKGLMNRHNFNAVVTDQDMADTFMPPFQSCIKMAHVSSLMLLYTMYPASYTSMVAFQDMGMRPSSDGRNPGRTYRCKHCREERKDQTSAVIVELG